MSDKPATDAERRNARRAAALRANLRRRKARERAGDGISAENREEIPAEKPEE